MTDTYDFIIVGGGTSGCVLASRLANTFSAPRVLLIEAGGSNEARDVRNPANRYTLPFTQPTMTFPYKSIPQKQLDGQQIGCQRGRGLGGSSAINFSCWLLGHKEDYNEWARLVGDDSWKWDGLGGVKERFRKIENLHNEMDEKYERYVGREAMKGHSKDGKVDLSYAKEWNEVDTLGLEAGIEFNGPINPDINSGDPTGFGMGPTSYHNGLRSSAATSYISSPPENLTIVTNAPVARILFDSTKSATGVHTIAGQNYHATKEVILSAGAIDSPKLLLLSGIGPSAQLNSHSIPIIHALPGVGQNLKDHCFITTTLLRKERTLPSDYDPYSTTGLQTPMAYLSSSAIKTSPEFLSLLPSTRTYLSKVPSYEFLMTPNPLARAPTPRDNAEIITIFMAVMNQQSSGSVALESSDPSAFPLIDNQYLAHPYDKRVAIVGLRDLIRFSNMPAFKKVTEMRLEGPDENASEEELWDHCRKAVQSVWHFGGTCKMGGVGDEDCVVDREFKVRGVERLRVVDHSIAPLMTNNHTQTTAYMIGEVAAEKMITEYAL